MITVCVCVQSLASVWFHVVVIMVFTCRWCCHATWPEWSGTHRRFSASTQGPLQTSTHCGWSRVCMIDLTQQKKVLCAIIFSTFYMALCFMYFLWCVCFTNSGKFGSQIRFQLNVASRCVYVDCLHRACGISLWLSGHLNVAERCLLLNKDGSSP